jgi:xanthine/CO dehydrogenase XdhC/CoxF family maturation factor
MNRRETERILDVIHRVRASGERAALATIVRVKGSAYRREGARIVVRKDRTYGCLLSGGCLEPAVADAAARVMATGEPPPHLERDERSLSFALASEARYIGVLGPRRRYLTLMERLRANGAAVDAASLTRVRSPVGLALGAETPEEIAVSIVGEIIAVLRGFDAGFLAGRESSLHAPDNHALARS